MRFCGVFKLHGVGEDAKEKRWFQVGGSWMEIMIGIASSVDGGAQKILFGRMTAVSPFGPPTSGEVTVAGGPTDGSVRA